MFCVWGHHIPIEMNIASSSIKHIVALASVHIQPIMTMSHTQRYNGIHELSASYCHSASSSLYSEYYMNTYPRVSFPILTCLVHNLHSWLLINNNESLMATNHFKLQLIQWARDPVSLVMREFVIIRNVYVFGQFQGQKYDERSSWLKGKQACMHACLIIAITTIIIIIQQIIWSNRFMIRGKLSSMHITSIVSQSQCCTIWFGFSLTRQQRRRRRWKRRRFVLFIWNVLEHNLKSKITQDFRSIRPIPLDTFMGL